MFQLKQLCSLSAIALSCSVTSTLNAQPDVKPNVLMIYYDDMGYGDFGTNFPSNPKSLTPNMDQFAKGSLNFTNGHSADGVCSPSRYALMTGRYAWRTSLKHGVTGGYSKTFLDADRFTIGKMFQQLGYKTAMVGKWHIGMQFYSPEGEPVDLKNNATVLEKNLIDFSMPINDTPFHRGGFDYFFGTSASLDMPPYAWMESRDGKVHMLSKGGIVSDGKVDFSQAKIATNQDLKEGKRFGRPGVNDPHFIFADYLQVQAAKVAEVIAKHEANKDPFFIYVPMPAPHTPHTVQHQFQGSAGWQYGDYMVQTDHYTGEILKALGDPNDPNSLAANTIVFITSDNGPENVAFHTSMEKGHDTNGPWAGRKRDNYEGGTRVPFLVRWPQKINPGETNHPCWQGDFMASMAALLNHPLSADQAPDAESFLPVLLGKEMPEKRRKAFIQHSAKGQFAIVDHTGEWKLIDGTGGGGNSTTSDADNKESLTRGKLRATPRQLFNLKHDPGERHNLLAKPSADTLAKEKELYALLNDIRGDKEWGRDGSSNVPRK